VGFGPDLDGYMARLDQGTTRILPAVTDSASRCERIGATSGDGAHAWSVRPLAAYFSRAQLNESQARQGVSYGKLSDLG
jgi:hypothetical protein